MSLALKFEKLLTQNCWIKEPLFYFFLFSFRLYFFFRWKFWKYSFFPQKIFFFFKLLFLFSEQNHISMKFFPSTVLNRSLARFWRDCRVLEETNETIALFVFYFSFVWCFFTVSLFLSRSFLEWSGWERDGYIVLWWLLLICIIIDTKRIKEQATENNK